MKILVRIITVISLSLFVFYLVSSLYKRTPIDAPKPFIPQPIFTPAPALERAVPMAPSNTKKKSLKKSVEVDYHEQQIISLKEQISYQQQEIDRLWKSLSEAQKSSTSDMLIVLLGTLGTIASVILTWVQNRRN